MVVHRSLAALALPLVLAACGSGGGASPAKSSTPSNPPAVLVAALLTVSDLPSGFTVTRPYTKPKYTYDPAACGKLVTVGAIPAGPHTAVAEFEDVAARSRILEVLSHDDDPAASLKIVRLHLSECRRYTLTDPLGRRTTVDGEFTTDPTSTGAFVVEVTSTGAVTEHETLAGQPAGKNVVILAFAGPTPPDTEETTYLVRAAVARAQHA